MKYKVEKTNGKVTVVERSFGQWAVIDLEGNEIVPFGMYAWIDEFDSGLARVKSQIKNTGNFIQDALNQKWGIINEQGEVVLPVEYDSVWKFAGKGRTSTRVEKDGIVKEVYFSDLTSNLPEEKLFHRYSFEDDIKDEYYQYDQHGEKYGEYAGSYAQDFMGYSDDYIDDAFEGDPENYWNID